MRLFKFVGSRSAVISMAGGSLKFTPIHQLNDPSEMLPIMDHAEVRASLQTLRDNGITRDQFKWLHCQEAVLNLLAPCEKVLDAPNTVSEANRMLSLSAYDNLDNMQKKLFSTIKLIRAGVGILSLSERYDSLPMWAHYADQANGFVVGFKELQKSFPGDATGSFNVPKPVVYSGRFLGMTFDPSTQDRLFFSKHSDWSYEREWRVVTPLSVCRRSTDGELYFRNIDPLQVESIICGWRVNSDELLSLRNELFQINPNVRLKSAALSAGEVVLNNS